LDSVDKVMCVSPFLAILDVIAALYVKGLGDPFARNKVGLFANLLSGTDLLSLYIYAVAYLIVMFGLAIALLYAKDRLDSSSEHGGLGLLAVAGIAGVLYVVLSEGFIVNFFLRSILERGIDFLFWLTGVVYLAAAFNVGFYVWHDVVAWVRSADARR
jgi:hypothetical protein